MWFREHFSGAGRERENWKQNIIKEKLEMEKCKFKVRDDFDAFLPYIGPNLLPRS